MLRTLHNTRLTTTQQSSYLLSLFPFYRSGNGLRDTDRLSNIYEITLHMKLHFIYVGKEVMGLELTPSAFHPKDLRSWALPYR